MSKPSWGMGDDHRNCFFAWGQGSGVDFSCSPRLLASMAQVLGMGGHRACGIEFDYLFFGMDGVMASMFILFWVEGDISFGFRLLFLQVGRVA